MKIEEMKITKIVADAGKILTNGEIYGRVIALGVGDNVENYHEITEAEYEKMLEADAEVDTNDD